MSTANNFQSFLQQTTAANLLTLDQLRANVKGWQNLVKQLTQGREAESDEEENELKALTFFVETTLMQRLDELEKLPAPLRQSYIRAIIPFYSSKGIGSTITRLFDVDFEDKSFHYRPKEDFEKEMNILLDLYKIKKSIECIVTMSKKLKAEGFTTQLKEDPQAYLETLKEILKVFFIQLIRPEYQKELYHHLSEDQIQAEKLLQMKKINQSYVKPDVLMSRAHQTKMLLLLYSTKMRTMVSGKPVDLNFNYLNFELLKQDYLLNWMQEKLGNSRAKERIYAQTMIGSQSLAELVESYPDQERQLLLTLPQEQFTDLAAEINENVGHEHKTGAFTILSEKFGPLKRITEQLGFAKKKQVPPKEAPAPAPAKHRLLLNELDVIPLGQKELDFCFLDPVAESYALKFKVLKTALGPRYDVFHNKIMDILQRTAEANLLSRNKPYTEIALALFLEGEEVDYFLGIGMQAKLAKYEKNQKMQEITCYFNFCSSQVLEAYGASNQTRQIRGKSFAQYPITNPVMEDVLAILDGLIQARQKKTFRKLEISFKN